MARVTPQQAAEKYRSRTANATGDWVNGINGVQTAPGAAAAAAKDKWAAGVAGAKDKFAANSAAVPLATWKMQATAKSGRYQTGTEAAVPKMVAFMQDFLPFQDNVTAQVKAMPSNTPEQREQRAIAQMRGTRQFKRAGR